MPSKTVPEGNLEVQRIMAERGVGMKHAYAIAKREAAAAVDTSDVTLSQKLEVLKVLITNGATVNDSNDVARIMREQGSTIDGHDLTKMLWACQKSGWITLRERKASGNRAAIHGIRLRDRGLEAYHDAISRRRNGAAIEEAIASAQSSEAEVVETVKPSHHLDGPEAEVAYERPSVQDYIESAIEHLPEAGTIALEAYPLVTALVQSPFRIRV